MSSAKLITREIFLFTTGYLVTKHSDTWRLESLMPQRNSVEKTKLSAQSIAMHAYKQQRTTQLVKVTYIF
jgi:hypothetical protein